jgi:FdhD protein
VSGRAVGGRAKSRKRARVLTFEAEEVRARSDHVATEEPLEIRLVAGGRTRTLAVTMRTPGDDFELAAGYLHGERVVADRGDISRLRYCTDPELDAAQQYNVVSVELAAPTLPGLPGLDRHTFTSSACGVCGRASLESLEASGCGALPPGPEVPTEVLLALPTALRASQGIFDSTGGLHAAGLFTAEGELLCLREDVGRHNAVDKVVGWALLEGRLPLPAHILMVSGRSSYEIVQKALVAGVPVVCSVSAPSSLAVDVAGRFGMTLVGFLRDSRFNVYAGTERIRATTEVGKR